MKREDNRAFWDRAALFYTALQEKRSRRFYGLAAEKCRPYLQKEHRVLELACGTGQFTSLLAPLTSGWMATDFSGKMVEKGKKRQIPGAEFSVADATSLPFADASFDRVLMANALHIMPHPELALKEVHRVLKKDGVLLAPTFVYEEPYGHLRIRLLEWAGFQTFHRWTKAQLGAFPEALGFSLEEAAVLPGYPLPQGFFAWRKKGAAPGAFSPGETEKRP